MVATIINNSNKGLQAFMTFTDNETNLNPDLKSFQNGQIISIGSNSAGDINSVGTGKYIYYGLWEITTTNGPPDSWILYDTEKGIPVNNSSSTFSTAVSGNTTTGWVLLVTNGPITSKLLLYLGIAALVLLLLSAIITGIYFAITRKSSTVTHTKLYSTSNIL